MVRLRSDSTTYRSTQPIPDTPHTPRPLQTPRTPRSPHCRRPSLFASSSSRQPTTDLLRSRPLGNTTPTSRDHHMFSPDVTETPTRKLNSLPNANPTPSEILSMDLNVLAIHNRNSSTPSSKLSDNHIQHLNLSLPFDRILRSPSQRQTSSLESVHRQPQRDVEKTNPAPCTSPRPTARLHGYLGAIPRSSPYKTIEEAQMADEENNLFLMSSPRAIRNPRRKLPPAPAPSIQERETTHAVFPLSSMDFSTSDVSTPGPSSTTFNIYEDKVLERESTQSTSGGDLEKENHTPDVGDIQSNPFYFPTDLKQTSQGLPKTEVPTTPTGIPPSTVGTITRSKRLALGSISPWRWNTIEEHVGPAAASLIKGVKSSSMLADGTGDGSGKLQGDTTTISEWVESSCHAQVPTDVSAGSGTSSKGRAIPSSSKNLGPELGSAKVSHPRVLDQHPNTLIPGKNKSEATAMAAKLAESVIQPNSVAFNRRAQQVAGRIYYWKHGGYHLVSDQDKQQWPGEWKFDVFQDPDSPGSSAGLGSGPNQKSYLGKGKLTDRQLSGPTSKRMRFHDHRTGLSDLSSHGQSHREGDVRTTSPFSKPREEKLQDRYDFRERRILSEPLKTRTRRRAA